MYVHFPWCRRICPYCDFNVEVGRTPQPGFTDAILEELAQRAEPFAAWAPLRSVYFGGGTPSLWPADELGRVLDAARATLGLTDGAEVTLEANPEDVTREQVDRWRDAGITRVSLGAQSVVAPELVTLGRVHRADQVVESLDAIHGGGLAASADVIYGLPDQRWPALQESLDALVDRGLRHLSAYALTIEPGTHFHRRVERQKMKPPLDDDQAELARRLVEHLRDRGLRRYEVSSYAVPGHEAIHNSLYWVQAPYLGLGPGAHSHRRSPQATHRRENTRNTSTYMAQRPIGEAAEFEERLGADDAVAEQILTGVRTRWGVDLTVGGQQNPATLLERLAPELTALQGCGWLWWSGPRFGPTDAGFDFADGIARRLVERLDSPSSGSLG